MTVLDAFDCSDCDDADPEPATIGAVIGLDDAEYERAEAPLERLSAHASMACGGWSMSDATEGTTA